MKTRTLVLPVLTMAAALIAGSLAQSKTPRPVKFSAALNVGQERPHPKGTKVGASGRYTATLNGTTLTWRLTFTHLSGPATAAHIHMGLRGVNGPIMVPLCGPCTSPVTGSTSVTTDEINALKARKMYVNVHTNKNPNGEIRGQITRALLSR
jgi:CHRD domain